MKRIQSLNKRDELCRVIGAFGTHSLVVGSVMAFFPNTQILGVLIAGAGLICTIGAFWDLIKR